MTDSKLRLLLEKYMDGQTSLSEEASLARTVMERGSASPPDGISDADWKVYREMFAMFSNVEATDAKGMTATEHKLATEHKPATRSTIRWTAAVLAIAAAIVAFVVIRPMHQLPDNTLLAEENQVTDSLSSSYGDTIRNIELPAPKPLIHPTEHKTGKMRKHPYAMPVDRNLIAEAEKTANVIVDTIDAQTSLAVDSLLQTALAEQAKAVEAAIAKYVDCMEEWESAAVEYEEGNVF